MVLEYLKDIDLTKIVPPSASSKVYKDDCMFSFDTATDSNGLDICLTCHQAFSRGGHNFTASHAAFYDHTVFLNYRRVLKPRSVREEEQPTKMVKLEIKEQSEDDLFDTKLAVYFDEFDKSIEFPNAELPAKINETIEKILSATSTNKKEEIKAWEQEIVPCHHAFDIIQIPIDNLNLTQCQSCDLKENLWICLHCGSLGCGREQFGGVPGHSHALAHNQTIEGHHIAVKLGSLALDSADCYCYTCNDEVKVPGLANYLKTYGIDISNFIKTEKNLTELQIEQNVKWDFAMIGKDGSSLIPVFGPGLTGFKNLGNSCYLASVVQVLFSIPSFKRCYLSEEGVPAERILGNLDPAADLQTQLYKVGDGLLSGRYSIADETTSEEVKYQKGIKPSGFKYLVGQGHPEFCTTLQQDAFEFWLYLTDLIEKRKAFGNFEISPTEVFKFVLENKLKCTLCGGVRIKENIQDNITLPVNDELISTDDEGKRIYKITTIEESFEQWLTPESIDYKCPNCKTNVKAVKSQGLKTFPKYLVLSPQRIKLENWVPIKLEVPIEFQESLDLSIAKSQGIKADEVELPEEEEEASEETTQQEFEFNQEAMNALLSMGFPENRCKRALYTTGNSSNAETAMNWLFEHMEDSDIDLPFEIPSDQSTNKKNSADSNDISTLVSMGFTEKLANKALILNKGNVEQSVEWLFNNPNDDGEFPKEELSESTEDKISTLKNDEGSSFGGGYHLRAVICHKGTSIHSGHYVAFIKLHVDENSKEEKWVLFNDEKVTVVEDVNLKDIETSGYLYVFGKHI